MSSIDPLSLIVTSEFDYNYLINYLQDYRFPRNKIGSMLKSGQIIRVKKGLYVKGGHPYNLMVLADMIYGPSYVSQEYALAYYGMIPEKVVTVTNMCLGRHNQFETAVGIFNYEPLSKKHFPVGVRRVELSPTQSFLIASPEKALVDLIWKRSHFTTKGEIADFFEGDRRVTMDNKELFSKVRMHAIQRTYNHPQVNALVAWMNDKEIF